MAYLTDSGEPGTFHAEFPDDATVNTTAKTISMLDNTKANPLKALDTQKQWIIVEVRNIDNNIRLSGKHHYTEVIPADIPAMVEAIRVEMNAIHADFSITATHNKVGGLYDVYRGDESTAVALAVDDTDIPFTPPSVWEIKATTPFAPSTPVADENIFSDPTFDVPGDWILDGSMTVSGGKLTCTADVAVSAAESVVVMEDNTSYVLTINADSFDNGPIRFFIRNNGDGTFKAGNYMYPGDDPLTDTILNDIGADQAGIQGLNNSVAVFDSINGVRSV